MPTISDKAARALQAATIQRGKNKGLLLKNAPREPIARAAWYGAQIVCNPYKVSISALLFMSEEERAIYREIETIMEKWKAETHGAIVLFDQDRAALERMGAW
jgi:hypothetical protein